MIVKGAVFVYNLTEMVVTPHDELHKITCYKIDTQMTCAGQTVFSGLVWFNLIAICGPTHVNFQGCLLQNNLYSRVHAALCIKQIIYIIIPLLRHFTI